MSDPIDHVQSYEGAIVLATAMMYAPNHQTPPCPSIDFWKNHGEPILAALLFTASPCQRGGGIAWVDKAVSTLAEAGSDSGAAVGIADPQGLRFIRSLDMLADVQRDSILMAVRDAITPWLAA